MFTTRDLEDNELKFNFDNGLDQNLLNYCNDICKKNCGTDFDPECGDCHVTRLYYAILRLAEYEDIGLEPGEISKIKQDHEAILVKPNTAKIVNYDKLPSRGKVTSDGEKTKNHGVSCGGRCYVFYDENRWYRVECEKCGTIIKFQTNSLDLAIKIWNDTPDIIGM